jgi:nitrogen fixation protein NifB
LRRKARFDHELKGHPCFNPGAHRRFGRVHLPVAPRCNIKCGYCDREFRGAAGGSGSSGGSEGWSCAHENRPGTAGKVLAPETALGALHRALAAEPRIRVAAVAGPGDPLANPETFRTFELVRETFPQLILCLSTNGLVLPESVERLADLGVGALTVTVNSVDPVIGALIHEWIDHEGKRRRGEEAAALLIENQLAGIRRAVGFGLAVKVNTVLIPGVNDAHLGEVARTVGALGVRLMNTMPLYPAGAFRHLDRPTGAQVREMRRKNAGVVPQMSWCRQCRADACGLLAAGTRLYS